MEIPVYYGGEEVGQALVVREGLYTRVSVAARNLPEQILRAQALTEAGAAIPLGVLAPEGEAWTVTRRIPAASIPARLTICEILSRIPEETPPAEETATETETTKWREFDGSVLHCRTPGAQCRQAENGLEVRIPYDPEIPCELVPLFCFFSMGEEDGKLWLRLRLDARGEPVLPATADT